MRELNQLETFHISGADYSSWEVITISGISTGVAFGTIGGIATASFVEGIKCMVACSLPTTLICALTVGTISLYQSYFGTPDTIT